MLHQTTAYMLDRFNASLGLGATFIFYGAFYRWSEQAHRCGSLPHPHSRGYRLQRSYATCAPLRGKDRKELAVSQSHGAGQRIIRLDVPNLRNEASSIRTALSDNDMLHILASAGPTSGRACVQRTHQAVSSTTGSKLIRDTGSLSRRPYSTRTSDRAHRGDDQAATGTVSGDSQDAIIPRAGEDPAILNMTVQEYLNRDNMPSGRWINDRKIAELVEHGPERIKLAIEGRRADPSKGELEPGPGQYLVDTRIRTLIEYLHRGNKNGHVEDAVMEELMLGWPVGDGEDGAAPGGHGGGIIQERLRARREAKGTGKAEISRGPGGH